MGELALARFCRDHDLDVEAKVHWLHVLQCQPNHEEALRSLGVRWHHGQLLTRAEIDGDAKRPTRPQQPRRASPQARKRWEKHWTPRVERWLRAIREGDAAPTESIQHELQAVDRLEGAECLAAMAGLDRAIQKRCDWDDKKEQEAYRELSEKLVELLDAIPAPWTTRCLVQTAIGHPIDEVREAAADALGKRPMESYVPLLLAGMQTPIEASFAITVYPGGSVSYHHSVYREGAEAASRETRSHLARFTAMRRVRAPSGWQLGVVPVFWEGEPGPGQTAEAQRAAKRLAQLAERSLRAQSQAAAAAAQTQHQVKRANTATADLNQRIQRALSRATDVNLPADATCWWEWWRDRWYAEYELEKPDESPEYGTPGNKPVYERNSSTCSEIRIALFAPSCFAKGTPIWTVTGPLPVEEIKPGDRVLSQDPESGELAYKPVLETTLRSPSPMVKIHLGSDLIETTRGHMFFVSGKGWRMAKELATGDLLRGVGGAVSIDRLEQLPAPGPWYEYVAESPDAGPGYGSAYNLVVDDFHTFFVGDGRLLVRDNTLFGRPYGRVPGLPAY